MSMAKRIRNISNFLTALVTANSEIHGGIAANPKVFSLTGGLGATSYLITNNPLGSGGFLAFVTHALFNMLRIIEHSPKS